MLFCRVLSVEKFHSSTLDFKNFGHARSNNRKKTQLKRSNSRSFEHRQLVDYPPHTLLSQGYAPSFAEAWNSTLANLLILQNFLMEWQT